MIFLAITPKGLQDALDAREKTEVTIWCGAEAISDEEYTEDPQNISRFQYNLGSANTTLMAQVIDTITDHHPGKSIWVETIPLAQ